MPISADDQKRMNEPDPAIESAWKQLISAMSAAGVDINVPPRIFQWLSVPNRLPRIFHYVGQVIQHSEEPSIPLLFFDLWRTDHCSHEELSSYGDSTLRTKLDQATLERIQTHVRSCTICLTEMQHQLREASLPMGEARASGLAHIADWGAVGISHTSLPLGFGYAYHRDDT